MKAIKRFYWRAFTSIFLGISGVILLVSSIALYLAPSGRIARDTSWNFFTLSKDVWVDNHLIFGFAIIPFALYHLITNWKPFTCYLKKKLSKLLSFRQEFISAAVFSLVLLVISVSNIDAIGEITHYFKGNSQSREASIGKFGQDGRGRYRF